MKLKYVKDYVDAVHQKFPEMEKSEINDILIYGFRRFLGMNVMGLDFLLKDNKSLKLWVHVGKMFNKLEDFKKHYYQKISIKLRILKAEKTEWSGYYYFGLSDDAYRFYESQEDEEVKILENIYLFRLKEELEAHEFKHHFKMKYPEYKGYKFYLENYETSDIEQL